MNVSLTPELEKLVSDQVKSGRYKSASEVVREGLRLIRLREEKLQVLRREIDNGVKSLECGEGIEYQSVKELFDDVEAEAGKKSKRGHTSKRTR
ncbi:MAG: type II toxin-antitoxin system ParD family antitoxin [Blastocatellia bacterium]